LSENNIRKGNGEMIKDILENYRIENGISQKELADRLRVSQGAISHYELGTREPRPSVKKRIKDLTGCSTEELRTEANKRRRT
jgi:transcriptional regulator with XRE-family HTH domain